jgi:hypothetical protein
VERRLPDRPAISSFLAPRLVRVEGSKIAPMAWGQLSLRVSLKPLAPSTVHTVYAVLRSLMLSAVEDQLIPANPCAPCAPASDHECAAAGQGQGGGRDPPAGSSRGRYHTDRQPGALCAGASMKGESGGRCRRRGSAPPRGWSGTGALFAARLGK